MCRKKIMYPSLIFSLMWGVACFLVAIAQLNIYETRLATYFEFVYMNDYIILFSISSIIGFRLAHNQNTQAKSIRPADTLPVLQYYLHKYRWIMHINFILGISRIIAMVSLYGFDSFHDYRMAIVSNQSTGIVSLIIRLSNYSLIFANYYIALLGFYHGRITVNKNQVLLNFLFFAPVQMSTGGRLFILCFILYYFLPFILGRTISMRVDAAKKFLSKSERIILLSILGPLIALVPIMGVLRSEEGSATIEDDGFNKFYYITDGMQTTEFAMVNFEGNFSPDYGKNSFLMSSTKNISDFNRLKEGTRYAPMVNSILVRLYFDFGFYGSIIAFCIIAFFLEYIGLRCIRNITMINLIIFVIISKIMYESVIFDAFAVSWMLKSLALMYIFKKYIFKYSY